MIAGDRDPEGAPCAVHAEGGGPPAARPDVAASVAPKAGLSAQPFTTPSKISVSSFILQPTPITADNLQDAIDAGQITKADLCKGVVAASAPAACK